MKKSLRIFVALALVAVLALGCFSGCESKTFEQKYGITISDKTVTYDGNAYGVEIDVNKEVLKDREYTVEYKYTKDGQEVEGTSFKDAGVYEVEASVLVAGEDTPTVLKAKLTINKAEVEVELGNFFLRQGQGISSIGTASLSNTIKLQGTDTVKDLGKVSYEVYNGTEKVQDLSTLKPTSKETEALTVVMKFETEPKNYNFTFKNGKLYVLSSADYSVANRLKNEIANVPTSETINTFTYDQMQAFVDTADDIVTTYPGTSAIQRLMSGTVNVDSISGLLKTAKERLSMTYSIDFDLDTSVGKGYVIAIEHTANNNRNKDDDDFLSELMGTKKSSLSEVEYKDTICFAIVINDVTKYDLNNVTVRNKNFTKIATYDKTNFKANPTTTGGSDYCPYYDVISAVTGLTSDNIGDKTIYLFGTPRSQSAVLNDGDSVTVKDNKDSSDGKNYKHWYGSKNYGAVAGAVVNASLLGTLDGSSTITITPNYSNLYEINVGGESSNTFVSGESGETMKDIIPKASRITISAKGKNYFNAGATTVTTDIYHGMIPNGTVAKIAIQPKTGYVISEVEIGDTTISADKFTYNSYEYTYEFTVTEDMVTSGGKLNIYVKFVDSYSLKVKINGYEVKNSSKNGTYTDKNSMGTLKLSGDVNVSTDVPTVLKEKSLTIEVTPATNHVLTALTLTGKKDASSNKVYDLLADSQFSYINGKITLDISTEANEILSSSDVVIEAKFAEVYPIKVTSSRNGEASETATKSGNVYSTKYGKVTVYDVEDDETDNLYKGQRYYIQIESNTGYVPAKISIGGVACTFNTTGEAPFEYKRYQVIQGSDMYVLSTAFASTSYTLQNTLNGFGKDVNQDTINSETTKYFFLICSPTRLAAGENFTIDIEYDAYYFIDYSISYLSTETLTATLGIRQTVTSTGVNTEGTIASSSGGLNFVYNNASCIYKADDTLYAYFSDSSSKNKLTLTITPGSNSNGSYTLEDVVWGFGKVEKESNKIASEKSSNTTIDDAIGGDTPEKAAIKPGDYITISFDCSPVAPKTTSNS